MNRQQRTLVALSGSATDRALVAYARQLARLGFARHYHFVHVRTPAGDAGPAQPNTLLLRTCEDVVSVEFGAVRPDVSSSCHVVAGVRVDALLEFVAQQRCDLVLLGHRRARSGQRSLARRLAMIAPCSVCMVPEDAPLSIRNIVVPVDFSDHAGDSVEVATSIARAAGLPSCLAVHVCADPAVVRYEEHRDELRRSEQEAFDDFVAPLERHGVDVEAAFVEGHDVARTIVRVAAQHEADLIVMSTRGRSRAASILLGSVATQVMIEAPVALLAVKHYGAMMNLFQALQQSQFWARRNPKTN
jgi:SulP family sulfate permease